MQVLTRRSDLDQGQEDQGEDLDEIHHRDLKMLS